MQRTEGSSEHLQGGNPITKPNLAVHEDLSLHLSSVAKNQDKQAFTKLFEFFAPKIKRFGIKTYRDEHKANELVQDTMANVWKKAHLYDPSKGAATTWVYTVMRNASFDQLRKSKESITQNLGDDIWPIEQEASNTEVEIQPFSDHLMDKRLRRLVDELPTAQRVVLKAVYFQELSQEQLSQQLGVPIGTIKSRLRLALEKIRQKMGDQYHD
jgi:RNA polymerase sigma-70 factor (ECF subfamily)